MRRKSFAVILSFVCPFLFSSFNLSHEILQTEKDQGILQEEVTVTLKLVQVYVTDKAGNPVLDLEKSDFILYDNDEIKKITDFEKHILAKSEIKIEEKTAQESLFRMNRKFFILLDILANDQAGIIQSKEAAIHFIDTQLQQGDEVGIISYTPLFGLNIHTYLTSDIDKIRKAIKEAKEIPISKEKDPYWDNLRQKEEQKAAARHGHSPEPESLIMGWLEPPVKTKGLRNIKKSPIIQIREVTELAKALRYIPGIKHIMFFSGGGNPKLHKLYERLGMEMAGANCIVHTINTMGTRSNFLGPNRPRTKSLEILAKASGGKFFEDVSDYDVIFEDIQNLSGNYYILGYYISEKWDGRFHRINVEVKREGCQVYAQGGYFNPKPFSRFSEFEKNLHLIDLALSDRPYFQDPIEISLTTLPCSHKEELNCVILSKLPLDYLGGYRGQKLELINLVLNEEKKIIDSSRGEVDYSKLGQDNSYQYSILSLNPGEYECRVILRNLTTGKGAVGSSTVTIPDYQDSNIALFSPLVLIPEKKSHFLKLSMVESETKEKEDLSLNHIYPFFSNEYSPLIEELEPQKSRISAVLRYAVVNIQKPEIDLYANIVNETTEDEIPLVFSIRSSEKQGDTHVLFLDIELPELEPGRYALEFLAAEKTTKSVVSTAKSFRIK
jgi:VWFA-related protein